MPHKNNHALEILRSLIGVPITNGPPQERMNGAEALGLVKPSPQTQYCKHCPHCNSELRKIEGELL